MHNLQFHTLHFTLYTLHSYFLISNSVLNFRIPPPQAELLNKRQKGINRHRFPATAVQNPVIYPFKTYGRHEHSVQASCATVRQDSWHLSEATKLRGLSRG